MEMWLGMSLLNLMSLHLHLRTCFKFWSEGRMVRAHISGNKNGAFGKTMPLPAGHPPSSSFSSFHRVWAAKPVFYWLERKFVIFAVFVKNPLVLAGQSREVLHGVGADGVGVKFPHFCSKLLLLPLSFRRSRGKRRKRGNMRSKRGKMRRKRGKMLLKKGKITPTPSTPTPLRTSQQRHGLPKARFLGPRIYPDSVFRFVLKLISHDPLTSIGVPLAIQRANSAWMWKSSKKVSKWVPGASRPRGAKKSEKS